MLLLEVILKHEDNLVDASERIVEEAQKFVQQDGETSPEGRLGVSLVPSIKFLVC